MLKEELATSKEKYVYDKRYDDCTRKGLEIGHLKDPTSYLKVILDYADSTLHHINEVVDNPQVGYGR